MADFGNKFWLHNFQFMIQNILSIEWIKIIQVLFQIRIGSGFVPVVNSVKVHYIKIYVSLRHKWCHKHASSDSLEKSPEVWGIKSLRRKYYSVKKLSGRSTINSRSERPFYNSYLFLCKTYFSLNCIYHTFLPTFFYHVTNKMARGLRKWLVFF